MSDDQRSAAHGPHIAHRDDRAQRHPSQSFILAKAISDRFHSYHADDDDGDDDDVDDDCECDDGDTTSTAGTCNTQPDVRRAVHQVLDLLKRKPARKALACLAAISAQ